MQLIHVQQNPETWNKYLDKDGCPDTAPEQQRFVHDDDLDDIINDEDLCPYDPEDYDGDNDLTVVQIHNLISNF